MKAEEHFELAANAVRRKKYPQAIGYFFKTLKADPDYAEARKGLRAVALAQFDGKALPATLKGLGSLIAITMAKMKKNWDDGLVAGEKFLCLNPNHLPTIKTMIAFAEEQEYNKTLAHLYQVSVEIDPEDPDTVFEAADFLSDQGDPELYEKSIQMMDKVCELYPDDTDLSADRNKIQAKKVIDKFDKAESQADVLKNKDQAKELEEESQEIRTDDDLEKAVDRAQERVDSNPEDGRAREVLADLLYRKGKVVEAIEHFKAAVEIDPNNQNAITRLGDAKIDLLKRNAAKIEARAKKVSGDERKELLVRLKATKKKLLDAKLAEYGRRLKVNPNDLRTRFELGVLYFNAKAADKAIEQFQRSVVDAKLAFPSSKYLAQSFKRKKLYDLSIKEFENAGKKPGVSQADKLGVIYETAGCYEEMENWSEALAIYKSILEKDFAFKDVSAKVDEIQNRIKS